VVCTVCTDWKKGRLQRFESVGSYRFELQFDPHHPYPTICSRVMVPIGKIGLLHFLKASK